MQTINSSGIFYSIMKSAYQDAERVQRYAGELKGVFSTKDLSNLLYEPRGVALHRRINRLVRLGLLTPFTRGFYTGSNPDLDVLCMRVDPDCLISLASALARYLMIGTCPVDTVFAVTAARGRTFTGPAGSLVYVSAREELLFGFEYADGVRYATREKALLDTLYYYQKGRRFYFNVYSDINVDGVDINLVRTWLNRYRNPRFTAFVARYLDERVPGQ